MAIHLSLVFTVGVHCLFVCLFVSLLDMDRLFTQMCKLILCKLILVHLTKESKWIMPIKGDFCLASLVVL